jgi:hypothetical protein
MELKLFALRIDKIREYNRSFRFDFLAELEGCKSRSETTWADRANTLVFVRGCYVIRDNSVRWLRRAAFWLA